MQPDYENISNVYNNTIVATKDQLHGLIIKGAFKEVPGAQKIWDFSVNEKYTYAKKNDKIGYINKNGEWVIEPIFDKAKAFVNGLAPVFKDGKWGYINTKGETVIAFKFKDAEIFSNDGLAPVKLKKLWGFVNTKGEMVIEENYEITVMGFSIFEKNAQKGFVNGLARVKHKKSWCFINTKGEVLKNMWFKNLELFN